MVPSYMRVKRELALTNVDRRQGPALDVGGPRGRDRLGVVDLIFEGKIVKKTKYRLDGRGEPCPPFGVRQTGLSVAWQMCACSQ